jgi:hypothetical protein
MCSAKGYRGFATVGFPIRTSPDQRLFTASRGLSQCPTSFIGIWRQGIHRKPLVASPRDAEKLILFGLHKSVTIQLVRCCSPLTGEGCARRCPGHPSPFNLYRQGDPAHRRAASFPASLSQSNCPYRIENRQFLSSFRPIPYYCSSVVEMTGFEPVAFALQRRCSPTELHPQFLQVGLTGFEPVTPVLSGLCSNQLSYRPIQAAGPQQLRSDRKLPVRPSASTPLRRLN